MKKHNGSLLSYLNANTRNAAQPVSGYAVQQIDAEKIIPNEKNFYSIEGIEELANSLAVSDHIPPLEVVDNGNGTYRLISGERRLSATLYRIQRGEITRADLPCHVIPPFESQGALSAEQMETLSIILANNYRHKTALDQLKEVRELEPIAKAIYEEAKGQGGLLDETGKNMKFRTFFAEQILSISPTALQRLQTLSQLSDAAKEAFDDGLISKSTASEIASLEQDEQDAFIQGIRDGEHGGTVSDARNWFAQRVAAADDQEERTDVDYDEKGEKNRAQNSDKGDAVPCEENASEKEADASASSDMPAASRAPSYEETLEKEEGQTVFPGMEREKDTSDADEEVMPEHGLDMKSLMESADNAEKDANKWILGILSELENTARSFAQNMDRNGDTTEAAKWELRSASLRLVIETIR